MTFWRAKGHLLHAKRRPFALRKDAFCFTLQIRLLINI